MTVRTVCCVLLVLGLAGCSQLQQLQQVPQTRSQPSDAGVVQWMEAANVIRESSPDRQLQMLEVQEAEFERTHDLDSRMNLVLLLATGAEQVRDRLRARRLLNGIDPLPKAMADREFISLLMQMLDEQGQYERKLSILWKQVTAQNRRVEELEEQLQALTNIEKNIQSREAPVSK